MISTNLGCEASPYFDAVFVFTLNKYYTIAVNRLEDGCSFSGGGGVTKITWVNKYTQTVMVVYKCIHPLEYLRIGLDASFFQS